MHRRTTLLVAGFALIAMLNVIGWKMAATRRDSASRSLKNASPLSAPESATSTHALAAQQPADNSNSQTTEALSPEALAALVATRVRDWESDDDPELREARTVELETILARGGKTIGDRLKLIEPLPDRAMDFAFGLPSFQQWMFSNPNAALEWMSAHPGISEARMLSLFQDWVQRDHAAFSRYLENLPPDEWREKALVAAAHATMTLDPATAINRARALPRGPTQNELLEMATTEWARRDPTAAGRWVEQVRDPALRTPLMASLLIGYAEIAPDLAAQWASDALPAGKILENAHAEIALASARQEPTTVQASLRNNP